MENEEIQQEDKTVILQDESLKQFQGGFTAIPNRILQNGELSLGARMTYAMLLKYAWQDDFCFPAQERIANDLGVTARSVRTFLNELRETNLITWKRKGLNRPNTYYILKLPNITKEKDKEKSGAEKFSAPDRKPTSAPDRKPTSAYKHSYYEDTINNVNVASNTKNVKKRSTTTGDARAQENNTIDELMRQLGDHNPRSKETYRLIIQTLGDQSVWHILGLVKEASQQGTIQHGRAPYFVGIAKNIAKERGLTLNFAGEQNGIELSSFLSEFAARVGNAEVIRDMRNKDRDDLD